MKISNVDIHSDDYALSINTSKDILECCKKGCLDSFSIMANMPDFEECVALLYKEIPNLKKLPKISVHLNFVEGEFINNCFPMSWGQLFIKQFSKPLKNKLKVEMKYQIEKVNIVFDKCVKIAKKNNVEIKQTKLRIDSHVHTHLIPCVWNALVEVIEEEKYEIEYIRNPKEPLLPFICKPDLWLTYNTVNFLKNRILMLYSKKVDNYCLSKGIGLNYMVGLIMSGKMDFGRIKVLYPSLVEYARKNNRDIEFLFHVGYALSDEVNNKNNKDYFNNFNHSGNRMIEKNAVLNINGVKGE